MASSRAQRAREILAGMQAAQSTATAEGKRPSEVEQRPRALFLGKTYAGWHTRFLNLQAHIQQDGRLDAQFRLVTGWQDGGLMERVPHLPRAVAGRLRATVEASAFAALPRPDVVWSSALEVLFPYAWAQLSRLRRPLILELDWTLSQQEALAEDYFGREPRRGPALALARWRERTLWRSADAIVAWSHWARDSLVRQGVPSSRVHVIPPGVDLQWWAPANPVRLDGPLRLLFVGGDFARKGGPELLRTFAALPPGACELDIVSRSAPSVPHGVRVHAMEPNSPELRRLYQAADLFVLPTRAECLGIAAIEAMACGKPVLMTDVGGARDIVVDGETGWLIESPDDVSRALQAALSNRSRLKPMGVAARERAERLYDGVANDRLLVDLLLNVWQRRRRQPRDDPPSPLR